MKTLAPGKNGGGSDAEVIDVPQSFPRSEIQLSNSFEGDGASLIICNSQLASSFCEVKCNRTRAKAGHYLHKVLLGKLKSQSVPSLDNDVPSDNEDAIHDDVSGSDENCKEDWFKTWPDCIDKEKLKKEENARPVEDSASQDVVSDAANPNTPRSLKDVHLPLAYNPITKGLHLIQSPPQVGCRTACHDDIRSKDAEDDNDCSQKQNGLSLASDSGEYNSIGSCSLSSENETCDRPKRRSISGIFSRSVFGWKVRDQETWSLFSRSDSCSEERRSIGYDQGTIGSTGLIQLERPAWLPAKPTFEHQAHIDQHSKILSSNRKKELKEAKLRQKLIQMQLKEEEETSQAARIWLHEIFPKWPTSQNLKRTQELWWQGIPPCARGKIWKLAISNDLNLTHDLYLICLSRALEILRGAAGSTDSIERPIVETENDRVRSMELIKLDIGRTFPHLCIFQKKGPYYDMLHSVLAAYVCYRPDVGYVQGMSFIAAVLILNMDAPDAFVSFANILNRPLHRAFFALDQRIMNAYYSTYNRLLKENLPHLYKHLQECKLSPDLYLLDWLYTVFAKATHLDLACRLWDVFLRDGEEFLFKAALGVLKMFEHDLMTMDFLGGSKFLTRLPEDLSSAKLFKCISGIKMSVGKCNFQQILLSQKSCCAS